MVSEDVNTRIQPGNVIWTAAQVCFDPNDLGPVSIQNNHSNGGYIRVQLDLEGKIVHFLTTGDFSPRKTLPWPRVGHPPSDQVMETTESTCVSFINHSISRPNWAEVETIAEMLGLDALAASTCLIALSDQEVLGPNRRRQPNRPPASAVVDRLIEGVFSDDFTRLPTTPRTIGPELIQFEAGNDADRGSTYTVDAESAEATVEDVIETLKSSGFVSFAERIDYLNRELVEDCKEPELSLESLRAFSNFIRQESIQGSPQIWVDANGYIGLQWRIPDPDRHPRPPSSQPVSRSDDHLWGKGDGILLVVFLPSGWVKYSGTSGPVGQGLDRDRIDGEKLPPAAPEGGRTFSIQA